MPSRTTWSGALHLSYRLLPSPTPHLQTFLSAAEGTPKQTVLQNLPFSANRSLGTAPDSKRYREPKQLYETAGYLYEDNGLVRFTQLGNALKTFLPILNSANYIILARHAALAMTACQLRNPTGAGMKYDPTVQVFPFQFIWRAMLRLDLRLSSDELNRAIFAVTNESELDIAIDNIRRARAGGGLSVLGPETITGSGKNDRIIPMMSVAAFGWTLILDKADSPVPGHYHVRPECVRLLETAAIVRMPHNEFPSVKAYLDRISEAACLPKDLR